MDLSENEKRALKEVVGLYTIPEGAYNFRINGKSVGKNSTADIEVESRKAGDGLKISVKPNTKNQSLHIPVIISKSGLKEVVYNDFYVGEGADITIIAGCGIYNCGGQNSVHDGIHRLYVEKGAKVKYIEKHFGFGQGSGGKVLNPTTEVYLEEGGVVEMELEQIKGVDSTVRKTVAKVGKNAKLAITEKLMTHGKQKAESYFEVDLDGEDASVDIVSRAVAQDYSVQLFSSKIVSNVRSKGHSECDAIIMDHANVSAMPALVANSMEAELIHEAAIGKIAGAQITKLMSLG